jgi:hypothetical protein
MAKLAQLGMRGICHDRVLLHTPDADTLQQTYDKVRSIYAQAHGWEPPSGQPDRLLGSTAMREHIRSWINGWDLERLYPGYKSETVIKKEEVAVEYVEDAELQKPTEEATSGSEDPTSG